MDQTIPNDLEAYWMPFTANRQFKKAPRLLVGAEGVHYKTIDGRTLIDGCAGLWCVNAGHSRKEIVEAIQAQAAAMDYAPPFQFGHPKAFELASRVAEMMPGDLDHVFFTNSGSESVETALKIALAYHRAKGEAGRRKLIGRVRGYHGVNFGGMSVGGIAPNRIAFGTMLPDVDHLPHTHNLEKNAFSKGQPEWGAHLADELENMVALHGAPTIAAVIVEPMAGSTGVLVPPVGYLERLREICDKYGILLIFDEVITAFGRLGYGSAAERFNIVPDIMTVAKGITSATVPMGAAIVRKGIYEAFMTGPEPMIEMFHGYTYSGHPLAAAAGLATLDLYRKEKIFENVREIEPYWEESVHSLKDRPNVIDIRNIGLVGAIELAPRAGAPGARGYDALVKCFQSGALIRTAGDVIVLSPPLIYQREHVDQLVSVLSDVLGKLD